MPPQDSTTLNNPTKAKGEQRFDPTAETLAWPDLSLVDDLCSMGIPWGEALELSPVLSAKLVHLRSAKSINPRDRLGGAVRGTMADLLNLVG